MTLSLRLSSHVSRPLLVVAAAAAVALTTGCDDGVPTDTPLAITADHVGHAPGSPVTGEVIYPDGTMTVTLAAVRPKASELQALGMKQDPEARGTTACDYDADAHTYSCASTGLALGRYVVQVTDEAQPGEGTQAVEVVVTDVEDFEPTVGQVSSDENGTTYPDEAYVLGEVGKPVSVPLTGWGAKRSLNLTVVADGGKVVDTRRLTTDADGGANARIGRLEKAGYYTVTVTDGLWTSTVPMTVA